MPGIPEAEPERGPSFEGGLILLKPHTSFSLLECSSLTSVRLFRRRNSKMQSETLSTLSCGT